MKVTKIKAAVSQQSQQAAQSTHRGSSIIQGGVGSVGEEAVQDDQQPRTQRSSSNAGTNVLSNASAVLPPPTSATSTNLPEDIAIMEIILRFLQLLCENHNSDLQNYLRVQPSNKSSYNLVCETLQFLDCICGSTTGGLGLLGLWINENNVHLINQVRIRSVNSLFYSISYRIILKGVGDID